jgi:hypothetical protein
MIIRIKSFPRKNPSLDKKPFVIMHFYLKKYPPVFLDFFTAKKVLWGSVPEPLYPAMQAGKKREEFRPSGAARPGSPARPAGRSS